MESQAMRFFGRCLDIGDAELLEIPEMLESGAQTEVRRFERSDSINIVHTRCIVKTSGFTRGVCKNRGFY